jgi:hypothetical protein
MFALLCTWSIQTVMLLIMQLSPFTISTSLLVPEILFNTSFCMVWQLSLYYLKNVNKSYLWGSSLTCHCAYELEHSFITRLMDCCKPCEVDGSLKQTHSTNSLIPYADNTLPTNQVAQIEDIREILYMNTLLTKVSWLTVRQITCQKWEEVECSSFN